MVLGRFRQPQLFALIQIQPWYFFNSRKFLLKVGNLDLKLTYKVVMWLLSVAFASGLTLAIFHFAATKRSSAWLIKVHGFSISGAISLLTYAWFSVGLDSVGSLGLSLLLLAALGGVFLSLGFRARKKSPPDWIVFTHISIAFMGIFVILLAILSQSVPTM